jgi:hypothetical protein
MKRYWNGTGKRDDPSAEKSEFFFSKCGNARVALLDPSLVSMDLGFGLCSDSEAAAFGMAASQLGIKG